MGTQRALQGHLGNQGTLALRHLGTWALKALEALYWTGSHSLRSLKKYVRWGKERGRGAWGHWKANKNEQGVIEKQTKTNRGRGGGPSMCVPSLFLKKYWDFQNEVLSLFSSFSYWLYWQYEILNKPSWKVIIFSPVNEWRASLFTPALFILHNFSFFSLHCPLFSLRIFSKNGYLFIGYRYMYFVISS